MLRVTNARNGGSSAAVSKNRRYFTDPVYTGKAVAGLIDLIRKGTFNKEDNILFVHSGGSPALYANTSLFA